MIKTISIVNKLYKYYDCDNPAQLAEMMNISNSTLYSWIKKNNIDLVRIAEIAPKLDMNWLLNRYQTEQRFNSAVANYEEQTIPDSNLMMREGDYYDDEIEKKVEEKIKMYQNEIRQLLEFLKTYRNLKQ